MQKRLLALFLALVFSFSVLVSCGKTDDVVVDGGDRGADGSWDGVDFGGQEVKFCVSVNQNPEFTFPAADIYTRGPDQAGSNEVAKEVLARNTRASETLGITIVYSETNTCTGAVHEELRTIVQTAAANSPDIFNNDVYGLSRAMVDGLLWNVKNPGEGVKNYFDFEAKGWYTEYIKGSTFDQNKYYIFAGEYFIDIIRMAWVIYVNNDILESNLNKLPTWCEDTDAFYEYVADGFWDIDMIKDISSRVFVDGGKMGVTEATDSVVGFAINHVTDWVFSASSNVTLYYQDENDGMKPKVMESIDTYQKVADRYVEMTETLGVYWENPVLSSTQYFLNGNVLFAISRLGEMESEAMRSFDGSKGLVPVPKWDWELEEDYHTCIHDQAELGCILNTAKAYSAASALMQYLNENSNPIVNAYYEKGLKYKYNDDPRAREMMDLIRDTTDSPFGFQIGVVSQTLYTGTKALNGMWIENNTTCASTFASERDAYVDCLNKMLDKFAKIP